MAVHLDPDELRPVVTRLKRARGQLDAVIRMLEDGQDCERTVTGDERLEDEGKADQVKSDVADAVKDGVNKVVGSFKDDSDK